MRIALTGASGQLGTDLRQTLRGTVIPLGHQDIELGRDDSVSQALTAAEPDIVINTAAYNFVDKAEDEPQVAFEINTLGPRRLARFCAERNIPLVHFSTDYVFGADAHRREPYRETDSPGPLGMYAVSKLSGEYAVRAICPKHFVIRTCGLYGVAALRGAGKGNFIETMLRLGGQRPELTVVNDQRCTPTATMDLARAVSRLIETTEYGLYHATSSGDATWYELAVEIFRRTQMPVSVKPVTSAEFKTKSKRPTYSVLNCDRLASVTGETMPHWSDALERYLHARSKSQ